MPAASKPQASPEIIEKLRQAQSLIRDVLTLLEGVQPPDGKPTRAATRPGTVVGSIRFDLNERAFVKTVARPLVGGPRKFVALVAYLAKGKADTEVDVSTLEKLWNRTSAKDLLGMKYNAAFASRAKTEGWVNSKKRGIFVLEESWQDAISSGKPT